jgi:hypothetical protein
MRARWIACLLLASGTAFAADSEFDHIVKSIESHYGTKPVHIPLMGLANFFVKVARPEGVSGFKIAVFEHLDAELGQRGSGDLDRFMDSLSGGGLHPLIRSRNRNQGESTYIYTGEVGQSTKMLIVTYNRSDATVIEVRVTLETLIKALQDPGSAGRFLGGTRDE